MASGEASHQAYSSPGVRGGGAGGAVPRRSRDRKSTRLNSSHQIISYAVFCLKKKNNNQLGRKLHEAEGEVDFNVHQHLRVVVEGVHRLGLRVVPRFGPGPAPLGVTRELQTLV